MALYTVYNKSNQPVLINSPSNSADDLYLNPGQSGYLSYLPVLAAEMAALVTVTVVPDTDTAAAVLSSMAATGAQASALALVAETGRSQVRVTPLTGTTVAVPVDCATYIVQPAGTIAALTLNLAGVPTVRNVKIITTAIITTLTMGGGGSNTLLGGLTAGVANGYAEYEYYLPTTTWYRCG